MPAQTGQNRLAEHSRPQITHGADEVRWHPICGKPAQIASEGLGAFIFGKTRRSLFEAQRARGDFTMNRADFGVAVRFALFMPG